MSIYSAIRKIFIKLYCSLIWDKKKKKEVRKILLSSVLPSILPEKSIWYGKHTYFGGNLIRMHKDTTVGAFCSIGQNVSIGPSQHPTDWLSTAPFQYVTSMKLIVDQTVLPKTNLPTTIENDVWIGNNAIIKDGVKIANGCVIGSNAVVTHDTIPYGIYGGVPAKLIRKRFSDKTIDELQKLKWWDLDDEIIATLPFNNIEECIKQLKKIRSTL